MKLKMKKQNISFNFLTDSVAVAAPTYLERVRKNVLFYVFQSQLASNAVLRKVQKHYL